MGQIIKHIRQASQSNPEGPGLKDMLQLEADVSRMVGCAPSIELVEKMPLPRFIKTHLGVKFYIRVLEQRKTKFIVVMRNVKDTLVSLYHFYRANIFAGRMTDTFEDFMDLYKRNKTQNWFHWNLGWWKYRDDPNVIFFTYEDMKADDRREVRRLVDFLGIPLSDDVIADVCGQCSFGAMSDRMAKDERMKKFVDPKISPFMRKG